MKIFPVGSRVFVRDIPPVDEVTARARAAGLHVVVLDENVPRPSSGIVVALGSDPLVLELVQLNDLVFFSHHAGVHVQVDGEQYRSLELREIISVARPDSIPSSSPQEKEEDAPAQPISHQEPQSQSGGEK